MPQEFQKTVCFYFQVHQPFRLRDFSFFEDEHRTNYFLGPKNYENDKVFEKVAHKCYLPATFMLIDLIEKHPEFKVSFSLSGVFLDQCEQFGEIGRQVLKNFQQLAQSSQVEILAETYYHSLSFLYSKLEFARQVEKHLSKVHKLFKLKPRVFRNTELIYSNEIANFVKAIGFSGILSEGWEKVLENNSPHHVLKPTHFALSADDLQIAKEHQITHREKSEFGVLLKEYKLSDDIAFRFGDKNWKEHPLSADKFADWANSIVGETINLFMDFETIGEHQWEETGIFEFCEALPEALLKKGIGFKTPSETLDSYPRRGVFNCPHYLSWADSERDLSAWAENDLQKSALEELRNLEQALSHLHNSENHKIQDLIEDFRKLQTSDHLYYMSTKYWSDGDVHAYFSPFESPYEAYINFMNVLQSMKKRLKNLNIELE
jgi:alpha-amylase